MGGTLEDGPGRRPCPAGSLGPVETPRRHLLVRHGRSTYNVEGRLNGDPSIAVGLDPEGMRQSLTLRERLAAEPIDLAGHTRLVRTRETLDIVLGDRPVPRIVLPELDDIRLGAFEGMPVGDYRAWRRRHGDGDPLPGGESRLAALARYADGFERLVGYGARCALVVLHDIPIRFLANAARGEDPLRGPVTRIANASVTELTDEEVRRGIAVMRDRLAR